jgi:hypothetical protein
VRELLREAAERGPLVVEGRDIGTAVFPDAPLKLFVTADLAVRARRRYLDLVRIGRETEEAEVAREMSERDARDTSRSLAPLRQAKDAVRFDTSEGTLEEQIAGIVELWSGRVSAAEGAAAGGADRGANGVAADGAERGTGGREGGANGVAADGADGGTGGRADALDPRTDEDLTR